jgi:hypothetical protein
LTLLLTWQTIALNTYGIAGDLFWQYGDTISYGETPQDENTIYYNTSAYEQVVTEHIERIDTTYYEPIDRCGGTEVGRDDENVNDKKLELMIGCIYL